MSTVSGADTINWSFVGVDTVIGNKFLRLLEQIFNTANISCIKYLLFFTPVKTHPNKLELAIVRCKIPLNTRVH